MAGVTLLAWQRAVVAEWTALTAPLSQGGKFVHHKCGLSVPRQNGKSDAILFVALTLAALGYKVLWTEHRYSTAVEMLRRLRGTLGHRPDDPHAPYPALNALVRDTSSKTAQEAFFLKGGGCICLSTRTESVSLGFSFDVAFFDEAQLLTDGHMQTILPTMTSGAKHNSLRVFTGTPPRAGMAGETFYRQREDALSGTSSFCWWEWGVDEVGDIYDESRWWDVNPALSAGLADVTAIREDLPPSMLPVSFAQEHLGYWLPGTTAQTAMSKGEWASCAVADEEAAAIEGITSYGVKFSPDGLSCALSACVRPRDGSRPLVELVDVWDVTCGSGPVIDWIASRTGRFACVAIDGKGGTATLVQGLKDAGVRGKRAVVACTPAEMQAASGMFLDAVRSRGLAHIEDEALSESVCGCVRRAIGANGGFGFGDGPEASSVAVESAALALWAARTTRRDPERHMEVNF